MMKRNLLIVFLSLTVSLSYADNWLIRFMKQLGETDTTYIEPQHYPGMLMLQNSYTFDRISLDDGKDKMVFAPDVSVGVGPFGGYKFFFAGYTVDMKSFFKSKDRTNLVFSIFTNPFVIDIYYRKAGNDFKLREITDPELKWLDGMDCSAITTRNFGFSFSYILNHKRYSAPAAFGQSTNQRRSAGSLILGAGYMRSKFDFNLADMVYDMVKKSINDGTFDQMVLAEDIDTDEPDDDEDLIMTRNARFNTFSLTAGYGYNWAFAHNWLLGAAVFVNPGLKTCDAHMENVNDMMENIDREDHGRNEYEAIGKYHHTGVNLDFKAHLGITYNNTRWYCGALAAVYDNHYNANDYHLRNTYGSVNLYAGFYFGKRKK